MNDPTKTPLDYFRESIDEIDSILYRALAERNKYMRILFSLSPSDQINFVSELIEEVDRWTEFAEFKQDILEGFQVLYDSDEKLKNEIGQNDVPLEYFNKTGVKEYIYFFEISILTVLKNRMTLSKKIGEYKIKTMSDPVFLDMNRKGEILEKYRNDPLPEIKLYVPFFEHIHDLSVAIQEKIPKHFESMSSSENIR